MASIHIEPLRSFYFNVLKAPSLASYMAQREGWDEGSPMSLIVNFYLSLTLSLKERGF
jgi:hypothetical protein